MLATSVDHVRFRTIIRHFHERIKVNGTYKNPFSHLVFFVLTGSLLYPVSQFEIPLMFRQFFGSLQNACEYGIIIGHKM